MSVVNVGTCPTFERNESVVEAHVLDFTGDLYGIEVELALVRKIRDERRFGSVEELSEQISEDIRRTRRLLQQSTGPESINSTEVEQWH